MFYAQTVIPALVLLLSLVGALGDGHRYVAPGGSGDGTSAASPAALNDSFIQTLPNGTTVHLAPGPYTMYPLEPMKSSLNFISKKDIWFVADTQATLNFDQLSTGRIVTLQNVANISFIGITFHGGKMTITSCNYCGWGGAVLLLQPYDVHFENCSFVENKAATGGGAVKAGLYFPSAPTSNAFFRSCNFTGNTAQRQNDTNSGRLRPGQGSAVHCEESISFQHCLFSNNSDTVISIPPTNSPIQRQIQLTSCNFTGGDRTIENMFNWTNTWYPNPTDILEYMPSTLTSEGDHRRIEISNTEFRDTWGITIRGTLDGYVSITGVSFYNTLGHLAIAHFSYGENATSAFAGILSDLLIANLSKSAAGIQTYESVREVTLSRDDYALKATRITWDCKPGNQLPAYYFVSKWCDSCSFKPSCELNYKDIESGPGEMEWIGSTEGIANATMLETYLNSSGLTLNDVMNMFQNESLATVRVNVNETDCAINLSNPNCFLAFRKVVKFESLEIEIIPNRSLSFVLFVLNATESGFFGFAMIINRDSILVLAVDGSPPFAKGTYTWGSEAPNLFDGQYHSLLVAGQNNAVTVAIDNSTLFSTANISQLATHPGFSFTNRTVAVAVYQMLLTGFENEDDALKSPLPGVDPFVTHYARFRRIRLRAIGAPPVEPFLTALTTVAATSTSALTTLGTQTAFTTSATATMTSATAALTSGASTLTTVVGLQTTSASILASEAATLAEVTSTLTSAMATLASGRGTPDALPTPSLLTTHTTGESSQSSTTTGSPPAASPMEPQSSGNSKKRNESDSTLSPVIVGASVGAALLAALLMTGVVVVALRRRSAKIQVNLNQQKGKEEDDLFESD